MSSCLPHWDMTAIFPSLDSPEFDAAFTRLVAGAQELKTVFDANGVQGAHTADFDPAALATVLRSYNAFLDEQRTVGSYLYCQITTDSRNELAQAKQSELQKTQVEISKLATRFSAWIGSLPIESVVASSEIANEHEFVLRKAHFLAGKLMSPTEEALAAELSPTGGTAWSRLHGNVTSLLQANVVVRGEQQTLPLTMVRNLASDPDRATRQAAYEAELGAWKAAEIPLAAAMNSVKGEVGLLSKRRGWATPLDETLFSANIDRATLDAMLGAARASFPVFRRYMRAKARTLGLDRLAWYDLFAPLGGNDRPWSYDEGSSFVARQFDTYSNGLGDFARRSFRENWVDAEPRLGKRDGAYCTGVRRDESRVFMNYKPAFGSVSTLAHELGHAYHNVCLAERTSLQRHTPMTLAETASIFCETIVRQAALREGTASERLAILEASLQGSCQVVVDISSRFLFESAVFDAREKRELSSSEFCERMLEAQRETYGDGLDPDFLHPYMWAMKPHYYSAARSFYNFPYMFGLLFGLGLYAVYQKDPEGFKARYDDLLSSTGLADAATLAARFGIDIRSGAFWEGSLGTITEDVDTFEKVVG